MLNEARTFTQVTFIIPFSRTFSCTHSISAAGKDFLFGAGHWPGGVEKVLLSSGSAVK
jgi:hypothetical protein